MKRAAPEKIILFSGLILAQAHKCWGFLKGESCLLAKTTHD